MRDSSGNTPLHDYVMGVISADHTSTDEEHKEFLGLLLQGSDHVALEVARNSQGFRAVDYLGANSPVVVRHFLTSRRTFQQQMDLSQNANYDWILVFEHLVEVQCPAMISNRSDGAMGGGMSQGAVLCMRVNVWANCAQWHRLGGPRRFCTLVEGPWTLK